jgi:predicted nucleotidyltransferase
LGFESLSRSTVAPREHGAFRVSGWCSGQDLGQFCDRSLGGCPRAGYRERVLDDALIAEAGRRLSEAAPPSSRVILFGSAARGELTRDSDLDFLVIEPEVENPALESVRLRRVLGDLVLAADVIVASEYRVKEWRDVRGSLIHAALAEGRELAA